MPHSNQLVSRSQIDALMDISALLADMTDSLELAEQIPLYLSRALDVDSLTLAIVNDGHGTVEPTLLLTCSSFMAPTREAAETLKQQVLAICRQTKPLAPANGPTLRSTLHHEETSPQLAEMPVEHLAAFSRATILTRTIDERHRLLLIVHQRAADAPFSMEFTNLLQLVSDQLARQLNSLVAWHARPEEFGESLARLTEREWMVLRGLNTEAGEKQLADQMGLSPHTLHSHIKAIYRKMNVQGRLPLRTKVEVAIREFRRQSLSRTDRLGSPSVLQSPSVAVG